MRRSLVLIVSVGLVAVASIPALANGTDVTGTVTLDGEPLEGVEVFLFDFAEGARYTCTDSSGEYVFADVDGFAVMATGPEVFPATPCSNPKFVDEDGTPLLVAFVPGPGAGPAVVDFEVEPLPDESKGFFNKMRSALNNCYDGNGSATAALLDGFDEKVERAFDKGKVSGDAADKYLQYATDLRFIAGGVCPQA